MNAAIGTLAIAGAVYLIYRARSAEAAQLGPGAILRAIDNARPAPLTPTDALAIVNQVNATMGNWHDPADVLAIIKIESNFDPTAYRYEAALGQASYGLMQILESTARDMGFRGDVTQLYDPATNIALGMKYMRWTWDYLLRALHRDPSYAEWIGAYNAGIGNVAGGFIPSSYVAKFDAAKRNFALA